MIFFRPKYAKVGGPPEDWYNWSVIDKDTGLEVSNVVEVNVKEGWIIKNAVNERGEKFIDPEKDGIAKETRYGNYKIVKRNLSKLSPY